jgi:hypothetical protein
MNFVITYFFDYKNILFLHFEREIRKVRCDTVNVPWCSDNGIDWNPHSRHAIHNPFIAFLAI